MPELIGSFFGLKVISLLCLTVFLGNYSVIKKNTRIQWRIKSSNCNILWIRGLQIPRFDRSNLFLRRIANPSKLQDRTVLSLCLVSTIVVPCKYYRCAL